MAWINVSTQLGYPVPGNVDDVAKVPIGTVAQFRNEQQGVGEFIYLPGAANVDAGDVCSYQIGYDADGPPTGTVAPWAGTANIPVSLAVASAAIVATKYGWYQIGGAAIVNCSGDLVAGDDVFWQAAGVISATPVAGKQMLNAIAAGEDDTPAADKVVLTIDRPSAQGADAVT